MTQKEISRSENQKIKPRLLKAFKANRATRAMGQHGYQGKMANGAIKESFAFYSLLAFLALFPF